MSLENDFLQVAGASGANVDTQTDYAGSGYQTNGFLTGILLSDQLNKCLRQGTAAMAAISQLIVDYLGQAVLDNGNIATLAAQIAQLIQFLGGGGLVPVAYSATPVFDADDGNVFEITLGGNVTSSTFVNAIPGVSYTWIIHQSSSGGDTFAWPSNVPGGAIDSGASATSIQEFIVGASGVYAKTPMGG